MIRTLRAKMCFVYSLPSRILLVSDHLHLRVRVKVLVLNDTFNNFSAISWRKPEYPERTTDLPEVRQNLLLLFMF
jgi:hypothetical protein